MTDAFVGVLSLHSPEPERDRFGRYMLPDPLNPDGGKRAWTRATTIASTLQDQYTLNQWQTRMAVSGVAKSESLSALASALDPQENRKEFQEICDEGMAAAGANVGKQLGTALHGFSELVMRGGDPMLVQQRWRPYVDRLMIELDKRGVKIMPEFVETILMCREIEVVGRTDAIVMFEGQPTIFDLKTEKRDADYEDFTFSQSSISIQLAIYAHSKYGWNWNRLAWDPFTMPIRQDFAIVAHLPSNLPPQEATCGLWYVDIGAGWEGAKLAAERVRPWRKRKGLMVPMQPPALPELAPALPSVIVQPEPVPAQPVPDGSADTGRDYTAEAQHRELMSAVLGAGEMADLARAWDLGHQLGIWDDALNAAAAGRAELLRAGA